MIGGNPSGTASDSNRLLPTIAVDGSDLIFTYRRTAESVAYGPAVEYGSNLTGWTTAEDSLNGVMISVASDEFGPGIDGVEVKIPLSLAAGGPLYGRLKVTIP